MLTEKRYEAALKQVSKSTSLVDGEMKPSDVIRLMIDEGQHAVALKYVHKFNLSEAFPPTELVQRALEPIDGELSVRTCAMLLKYVRLFKLEETYPMEGLLERIASSGITVHDMGDGKYVLKGRRRQVAQPGMASEDRRAHRRVPRRAMRSSARGRREERTCNLLTWRMKI